MAVIRRPVHVRHQRDHHIFYRHRRRHHYLGHSHSICASIVQFM